MPLILDETNDKPLKFDDDTDDAEERSPEWQNSETYFVRIGERTFAYFIHTENRKSYVDVAGYVVGEPGSCYVNVEPLETPEEREIIKHPLFRKSVNAASRGKEISYYLFWSSHDMDELAEIQRARMHTEEVAERRERLMYDVVIPNFKQCNGKAKSAKICIPGLMSLIDSKYPQLRLFYSTGYDAFYQAVTKDSEALGLVLEKSGKRTPRKEKGAGETKNHDPPERKSSGKTDTALEKIRQYDKPAIIEPPAAAEAREAATNIGEPRLSGTEAGKDAGTGANGGNGAFGKSRQRGSNAAANNKPSGGNGGKPGRNGNGTGISKNFEPRPQRRLSRDAERFEVIRSVVDKEYGGSLFLGSGKKIAEYVFGHPRMRSVYEKQGLGTRHAVQEDFSHLIDKAMEKNRKHSRKHM